MQRKYSKNKGLDERKHTENNNLDESHFDKNHYSDEDHVSDKDDVSNESSQENLYNLPKEITDKTIEKINEFIQIAVHTKDISGQIFAKVLINDKNPHRYSILADLKIKTKDKHPNLTDYNQYLSKYRLKVKTNKNKHKMEWRNRLVYTDKNNKEYLCVTLDGNLNVIKNYLKKSNKNLLTVNHTKNKSDAAASEEIKTQIINEYIDIANNLRSAKQKTFSEFLYSTKNIHRIKILNELEVPELKRYRRPSVKDYDTYLNKYHFYLETNKDGKSANKWLNKLYYNDENNKLHLCATLDSKFKITDHNNKTNHTLKRPYPVSEESLKTEHIENPSKREKSKRKKIETNTETESIIGNSQDNNQKFSISTSTYNIFNSSSKLKDSLKVSEINDIDIHTFSTATLQEEEENNSYFAVERQSNPVSLEQNSSDFKQPINNEQFARESDDSKRSNLSQLKDSKNQEKNNDPQFLNITKISQNQAINSYPIESLSKNSVFNKPQFNPPQLTESELTIFQKEFDEYYANTNPFNLPRFRKN